MLQACWECIAGSRGENEERNIRLNGSSSQRAPPWPISQLKNENMFVLPKQLSVGDLITVTGNMSTKRELSVSLVTGSMSPDYQNVACQLEVTFETPETNSNAFGKGIIIKTIKNGQVAVESSNDANGYFPDNNFKFQFRVHENELEINIGESFYEFVKLKHNKYDIRFLSVSGDIDKVETLDFYFA